MTSKKFITLGAALGLTASSLALARERPVKRSEVPEAVLRAVSAKYPGGEMRHFVREVARGKTTYEVLLDLGDSKTELTLAPDGKIELEERRIALGGLPDPVRKGLAASRFGKGKVLRVERVTQAEKAESQTYEIVVELAGKRSELTFDPAGKLQTTEPANEED